MDFFISIYVLLILSDVMEFANAEHNACADCNRSNKPQSEWTVATHLVPMDKKVYALCDDCFEVSHDQAKTSSYFEWLGRSGKTINVKMDNLCMPCCVENNKLVSATGVLGFQADIPACKDCKTQLDMNDSMLTYFERGWLLTFYATIRDTMKKGLEVVIYQ